MKVVILAGGFGTRLSEFTEKIPKPMVRIGGQPIIKHIMNIYAQYGHKDFYLALGYKSEVIKHYFINHNTEISDLKIDLSDNSINYLDSSKMDVSLINTGLNTMTGGRVKRMKPHIGNESFLLTYGDGVSNIDIDKLISFHKSHGKMVTVSGVRPKARFGELSVEGTSVKSFKEKPQTGDGWINGGFFVCEPEIFDLIDSDGTDFEKEPLEQVSKAGELEAYFHDDFWQCMDTKKDRDDLEALWQSGEAPWIFD
jgi:glucose-1-phosphate cytidylyltransferase